MRQQILPERTVRYLRAAASAGLACWLLAGCSLLAPFEVERHEKALCDLRNQGFLSFKQAKLADAERLYRQAGLEAQTLGDVRTKATVAKELGDIYSAEGKLKEAETCYRDFLALVPHPGNDDATDYAGTLSALAAVLEKQGRLAQSEAFYKAAFQYADNLESGGYRIRHDLRRQYARFLKKVGKISEAKKLESLEGQMLLEHAYEFDPDADEATATRKNATWNGLCDQALKEQYRGNTAGAERLLKQALAVVESSGKRDRRVPRTYEHLGNLYLSSNQLPAAQASYKKEIALLEAVLRSDDIMLATPLESLGLTYLRQKKYSAAEAALKRALAIQRTTCGDEDKHTVLFGLALADYFANQKRFSDAAPLYKKVLESSLRLPQLATPSLAMSLERLGDALCKSGQYAQARLFYKRSLTIRQGLAAGDAVLAGLVAKIHCAESKIQCP